LGPTPLIDSFRPCLYSVLPLQEEFIMTGIFNFYVFQSFVF
jgi:hypothetical protein